MKIIHIGPIGFTPVQPTGAGGIGKTIYFLTRYLAELGHEAGIIDFKDPVHKTIDTKATFFEVWVPPLMSKSVPYHLLRVVIYCISALFTVFRLKLKKKVDIIQTFNQFPLAAFVLAKKLLRWKTPVLHFVTNPTLLMEGRAYKYGNMLEGWAMKHADFVTMETEYIRQGLIKKYGISEEKTSIVISGIDLEGIDQYVRESGPAPRNENMILCVSRIHPMKNQLTLIKAFQDVIKVRPDARLVLAGIIRDDEYLAELERYLYTSQLGDKVEITGEVSQDKLYSLWTQAGLFVFPTLHETQGQVLIEAMAFGLPVIASKIGPIEHIVNMDRESAVLIDPQDTGEMSRNILYLLDNREAREKMAARGKQLVVRFSWPEITKDLLAVYERVLNERGKAKRANG